MPHGTWTSLISTYFDDIPLNVSCRIPGVGRNADDNFREFDIEWLWCLSLKDCHPGPLYV